MVVHFLGHRVRCNVHVTTLINYPDHGRDFVAFRFPFVPKLVLFGEIHILLPGRISLSIEKYYCEMLTPLSKFQHT
jgi:hypothetical protein